MEKEIVLDLDENLYKNNDSDSIVATGDLKTSNEIVVNNVIDISQFQQQGIKCHFRAPVLI